MRILRVMKYESKSGNSYKNLQFTLNCCVPLAEFSDLFKVDNCPAETRTAFLDALRSEKVTGNQRLMSYFLQFINVLSRFGVIPTSYIDDVNNGLATNAEITNIQYRGRDKASYLYPNSEIVKFDIVLRYFNVVYENARTCEFDLHFEKGSWRMGDVNEKPSKAENLEPFDQPKNNSNKGKSSPRIRHCFEKAFQFGSVDVRASLGALDYELHKRDDLLSKMMQVLIRKEKPNLILVGDNGVGKTTMIKLFADAVNNFNVPDLLKDVLILELDMMKIVSGTRYRGDFEERLQAIFTEIDNYDKRVILFVDEISNLTTIGGEADNAGNGASVFASYMQHGKIQIVGTCTQAQYAHVLDKVPVFRECTTKLEVPEIEDRDAITSIVANKLNMFKEYYDVSDVGDASALVDMVIDSTNKFLPNMKQPEKSVVVLDTAFAKSVIAKKCIDSDIILSVISDMSGVPLTHINKSEREMLLGLASRVKKSVIGQDEAVDAICNAIVANRIGLSDNKKPIANFLFAGSTGVGKTELCKVIAREIFGDAKAMIRIDMSEYLEEYSISKLIGSPKGYVGYGEGGFLTDAVEKKPYSVILFDEIEKAHPNVLNLLLQIMDDGRLTDSAGKTVDFSNCLIVMTSNLGARRKGESRPVGFASAESAESQRKDTFMSAIKSALKPEFLNRITEIVIFNTLSKDGIRTIARTMLTELAGQTASQGFKVSFNKSLVDYCVENGFDEENGARPMRNFIQKHVKSFIAQSIVNEDIVDNTLVLSYSEKSGIYDIYKRKMAKQRRLSVTP